MKKLYLFLFLSSTSVFAKNYTLEGRILEKNSKTPYTSPVNISIPELKKVIRSDKNGKFFIQFEYGKNQIELILSGVGIIKAKVSVTLDNLKTTTTLLVEARKIKGRSMRIQGRRFPDASKKSLTVDQIKNVPFSFGDPLSAASTLPGTGRSNNGFLGVKPNGLMTLLR